MTGLFEALEARFNANPTLRLKGRKLYEGFLEERVNVTKPYTEVNPEMIADLSSFSTDIETWELLFRYHAKDIKTNAAKEWLAAMIETFRDSNLLSGFFHCAGVQCMPGPRGPSLRDGLYDAQIKFRLILSKIRNEPVARGV